jgi:hypothetical protein
MGFGQRTSPLSTAARSVRTHPSHITPNTASLTALTRYSLHNWQVTGGANWQQEWFGVLPECKVLVVMLSKSYFASAACVEELKAACSLGKPMIPVRMQ